MNECTVNLKIMKFFFYFIRNQLKLSMLRHQVNCAMNLFITAVGISLIYIIISTIRVSSENGQFLVLNMFT